MIHRAPTDFDPYARGYGNRAPNCQIKVCLYRKSTLPSSVNIDLTGWYGARIFSNSTTQPAKLSSVATTERNLLVSVANILEDRTECFHKCNWKRSCWCNMRWRGFLLSPKKKDTRIKVMEMGKVQNLPFRMWHGKKKKPGSDSCHRDCTHDLFMWSWLMENFYQ